MTAVPSGMVTEAMLGTMVVVKCHRPPVTLCLPASVKLVRMIV